MNAKPNRPHGPELALAEHQRCTVRLPGGKLARGVIAAVLPKRYEVRLDGENQARPFSRRKVKPLGPAPKPRAALQLMPAAAAKFDSPKLSKPELSALKAAQLRPQPKPAAPERCPAYLDFVHRYSCCNCGTKPAEAHHEGKKGVGQKVRDTMAVPLCSFCHWIYTASNCLPSVPITSATDPELASRETSLTILRGGQLDMLGRALARMELPMRVELLSKAIAQLDADVLAAVLKRPPH